MKPETKVETQYWIQKLCYKGDENQYWTNYRTLQDEHDAKNAASKIITYDYRVAKITTTTTEEILRG